MALAEVADAEALVLVRGRVPAREKGAIMPVKIRMPDGEKWEGSGRSPGSGIECLEAFARIVIRRP